MVALAVAAAVVAGDFDQTLSSIETSRVDAAGESHDNNEQVWTAPSSRAIPAYRMGDDVDGGDSLTDDHRGYDDQPDEQRNNNYGDKDSEESSSSHSLSAEDDDDQNNTAAFWIGDVAGGADLHDAFLAKGASRRARCARASILLSLVLVGGIASVMAYVYASASETNRDFEAKVRLPCLVYRPGCRFVFRSVGLICLGVGGASGWCFSCGCPQLFVHR